MKSTASRPRLAVLTLLIYLLASALFVVPHGIALIGRDWSRPDRTDFSAFYAAGRLAGDSRWKPVLYKTGRFALSFPSAYKRAPGNFFNPPLLAFFYLPL